MNNNYTDIELVRLSIEDNQNFSLIIDKYEQKLFRYIMRLGDFHIEEAEDILQEIFIKVYIYLNEFDPSLSFSSWVYRITHNYIIDYFRHKNTRSIVSLNDDEYVYLYETLKSEEDIHFDLKEKDMQITVKNAIRKLPQDVYELIILRYIEDKSYEEISDILRIPIPTVWTLLHRAKKKLEWELQPISYHL